MKWNAFAVYAIYNSNVIRVGEFNCVKQLNCLDFECLKLNGIRRGAKEGKTEEED